HAPPDRHAFATTLKSLRSPRTRSHEEPAPGAAQQAPARKADPKREKITAAAQGQASPDGAEQAPEEMEALEAGDAMVDQMTDAAVAQAEDGSGAAGVGLVDSPEAGDEDNETADADAGGDGLVVTGQVGNVGAGDMS